MKHKLTNKCITSTGKKNNAKITLDECDQTSAKQQWDLKDLAGPWFQIESKPYSNVCIDVPGNSANLGQGVFMYKCTDNNDHDYKWKE